MRKKTIGEVFRLERRNQGIHLEEVERRTDIQLDYLEAIEADDFDLLPSPFYARSFLKQYAKILDLDEEIILEAYEHASLITYDEVEVLPENDRRMRRVRKQKNNFLPLFYLVTLSLLVVLFVGYFIWQQYRSFDQKPQETSISMVSSESSLTESQSSELPTPSSSSSPVGNLQIVNEESIIIATLSGIREEARLNLTVDNTTSWISISETEWAGGTTLSPSNPTISVNLLPGTTTDIVVGNTTGMTVRVNDQIIDLASLLDLTGTIRLIITE